VIYIRIRINNHLYAPCIYFPPLSRGGGSKSEEWMHYIEPLEKHPGNLINLYKISIKTIDERNNELEFVLKFPYDFKTIEFLALSYKITEKGKKKTFSKNETVSWHWELFECVIWVKREQFEQLSKSFENSKSTS